MIPQLIIIVLGALSLTKAIDKHGQPDVSEYNGWSRLISLAILYAILYAGGFWDVILNN